MKITMSPDRRFMTLEATDPVEEYAFKNIKTNTKANVQGTGTNRDGSFSFEVNFITHSILKEDS